MILERKARIGSAICNLRDAPPRHRRADPTDRYAIAGRARTERMTEPIKAVPDPMTEFNKMGMWDVSDVLSSLLDKFKKEKGIA